MSELTTFIKLPLDQSGSISKKKATLLGFASPYRTL